ncbi:hypothetical protein RvY_07525-2 [Ramazzottius varieornatus]|uniref:Uncharacterized protein n=1 Tax=Ramazzottius varieornatus TaxID=947166 RepID=A0A1D1V519_RAMVA|nr:hypothetical protein RvY_07525-2 [Ramazzottius varieornatus]
MLVKVLSNHDRRSRLFIIGEWRASRFWYRTCQRRLPRTRTVVHMGFPVGKSCEMFSSAKSYTYNPTRNALERLVQYLEASPPQPVCGSR